MIAKRTIVIISETFPPDLCGVADYVHLLSQALSATYDVHIITRAVNQVNAYKINAVTIHEIMTSKLYVFDVIQLLKKIKPDLVDIQLAYSLAANWLNKFNLFSGFTSSLVRLSLKAKLVCTVHELSTFLDDTSLLKYSYRKLRDYLNTQWFDYYFCVDRRYLSYFKHDRKLFLSNFSNIPSLVKKTDANAYTFLFFGTIAPHKKLDRLVSLFAELLKLEPCSQLLLVGGLTEGYDNTALQQQLAQLPTQSFKYFGRLNTTELTSVIANCSYALFPFSITDKNASVLAMMVNGLVVIAESRTKTVFETYGNNFYTASCLTAEFIDQVIKHTFGQPLAYKTYEELLKHHVDVRIGMYETLMNGLR